MHARKWKYALPGKSDINVDIFLHIPFLTDLG